MSGECLADEDEKEQCAEDQTERVFPQETLHRCSTPSAEKYARPAMITMSSSTNRNRMTQPLCMVQSYGSSSRAVQPAATTRQPPGKTPRNTVSSVRRTCAHCPYT